MIIFRKKKLTRFVPLTTRSLTGIHDSGTEECEISNQWHRRDDNFFRGKSRILITFSDTQEILSLGYGYPQSVVTLHIYRMGRSPLWEAKNAF
jgi:hypothetical protein